MRAVVIITAMVLAGAGCGGGASAGGDAGSGDVDADVDAGPPKPCWPDVTHTPQGAASLGTGREGFQTMPSVLPLEYGSQDGFMLIANVRMTGFAPGNPQNVLDPANPRTRIRAYFNDTNVPLNFYSSCPFRNAYVPSGTGEYDLVQAAPVIFETCWRSEHLFGKEIRVELELMDDEGHYTTDVKIVTAAPPIGFYPVDMGTPGCTQQP